MDVESFELQFRRKGRNVSSSVFNDQQRVAHLGQDDCSRNLWFSTDVRGAAQLCFTLGSTALAQRAILRMLAPDLLPGQRGDGAFGMRSQQRPAICATQYY